TKLRCRNPPSPFGLGPQGPRSGVGSPRRSHGYVFDEPPAIRAPGAPNGGALYFPNSLLEPAREPQPSALAPSLLFRVSSAMGIQRMSGRVRSWPGAGAALLLSGCMATAASPPAGPPIQAHEVASTAQYLTRPETSARLLFDWSLSEPGLRSRGRGVARVEPPYRARLDLFTPQGEAVAVAAMEGEEVRLPSGAPTVLPPPTFLWAALGVFRPDDGAALLGGEGADDGQVVLRYRLPGGDELHFRMERRVIHEVELFRGGRVVERMTREMSQDPEASDTGEAVYRDLVAVRELRVRVESREDVEPFPPDIWRPIR
ncbi:MAG: hypothetical protein WD942_01755, partial [Dehalococcoidia bacterium]